jgi:membrane fusion protein, multidrug efflux system
MSLHHQPLLAALMLLPVVGACARGNAEPPPPVAPLERVVQVRTVTLEPQQILDRATLPGDLLPVRRATLAAEVGGAVDSVPVQVGQWVKRGQLLATIDERALGQQVAEAEAWLRQAQLQYERAENLFERRAITKAQLLDAVTHRDVAESRLASARLQLDKARVRAPWAGAIASRWVETGDFVTPGKPLVELVDSARLKVRAPARSSDVQFLAVGREVEITVDAYPGEVFRARIERLGAELDPASRTLDLEAEIANPGARLRPGMLARVSVVRRQLTDALLIPQASVVELGATKGVYLVEQGRVVRRTVTLGPVVGEQVVVQGLVPGTRVIVEGHHLVSEGQKVEEI